MTPPTTNITESITYELGAIIDAIPDDAINSFASVDPSFKHGGFRPGQTAPVRKRLLAIATSDNVPLTDSLRRLLTRHSLNHTVVSRLSENTITELRHELAALFGTHRLILALQLDSRPEANKLAEHWLTNNTSFRSLSPQDAAQRLYNALGTICDACGTTGNGIATTKESWSDERRTLSEEIRDLRTQLRTLRSAEDRARNSQQQNETLTSELSSLKSALKPNSPTNLNIANAVFSLLSPPPSLPNLPVGSPVATPLKPNLNINPKTLPILSSVPLRLLNDKPPLIATQATAPLSSPVLTPSTKFKTVFMMPSPMPLCKPQSCHSLLRRSRPKSPASKTSSVSPSQPPK
jgi:hypothetical protein